MTRFIATNSPMIKKKRKITYDICQLGKPISQFTIECDAQINFIEAENFLTNTLDSKEQNEKVSLLSNQEMKVVKLLIINHEYPNKELAQKLTLSPSTISTYKKRIREKLEIKNMRELYGYKDFLK